MIVWQILAVALVFTAVVGIHELGHFLFARWTKMDVEEFSIGLGPKIFTRVSKKSGTAFVARCIPLGGFVRIKGMDPKSDGSEINIEKGFYSRGIPRRALVLFAGPLFSVLFAFVVFFGALTFSGQEKLNHDPIVGSVMKGSPAEKAGLLAGDRIVSIEGTKVDSFYAMRLVWRANPDKHLRVNVERGGVPVSLTVTPELKKGQRLADAEGDFVRDENGVPVKKDVGWVGIDPATYKIKVTPGEALSLSASACVQMVVETPKILMNFARLKEEAMGPASIATVTAKAAEKSFLDLLTIAAAISLSLGVFNLLPIPPLDGGQLLVCGIEALRGGRRLSMKVQELIAVAGIAFILLIFIAVFSLDIGRFFNRG